MKLLTGEDVEEEPPPSIELETVSQLALTEPPIVEDISNVEESAIVENPPIVEEVTVEPEPTLETFEVTAYTLHPSETGKAPGHPAYGITASGKRVEVGDVACPPYMEFGTRVHIPEMGQTFVCTDRGGAIKGNRLDIYMDSRGQAFEFGRQWLDVEIVK